MAPTVGLAAQQLVTTGPDDLVQQLNASASRHRIWPWVAGATLLLALLTGAFGLVVLLLGVLITTWLVLWEKSRRTVLAFYDVTDADAEWFDRLTTSWQAAVQLGGAWRVQASGDLHHAHQRKVNAGASSLVRRSIVAFHSAPPPVLTTNIEVPTIVCGPDALLFLPDRVLVRNETSWSSVGYEALQVEASRTRFIEEGTVPADATVVDSTWRYVNKNGGPDRRFSNNRQLPVLLLGELELRTATGLWWIVTCSRTDVAADLANVLRMRRARRLPGPQISLGQAPAPAPALPATPNLTRPALGLPTSTPPTNLAKLLPVPTGLPSAAPGSTGALFTYGRIASSRAGARVPDQLFAVVDVETTGLDAQRGDRVVEIAISRIHLDGRVEDEFATIVNPDRTPGAEFVHGINEDMIRTAPRFADVAGDILARLEGCVVVAHNAAFEDQFLAAEFARLGLRPRPLPALCTLWLSRQVNTTPNHRLSTLARQAGLPMTDAHAALGDVRAVAALLPGMLARLPAPLTYQVVPASSADVADWTTGLPSRSVRLQTRAVGLRRGDDGWMASLLARLPQTAEQAEAPHAEAYLAALGAVLLDGKIVADEAHQLAALAGGAGLGAAEVRTLNATFLESLREAAFEDEVLTPAELRHLRRAATMVGAAAYFDDLTPTAERTGTIGSAVGLPATSGRQRRCGYCQQPGHYRPRCPQLI
ncbi:3'-5' exonuclease [Microlunatus spumicola]